MKNFMKNEILFSPQCNFIKVFKRHLHPKKKDYKNNKRNKKKI